MTLLVPLGLAALLTLPLIALLHLIRERRRRVAVPSLLLWQHLPQQPSREQRRRLPLTLLLLLHLLVAALLALALAQPQWLGALLGGNRNLAIIIDTSTSMNARDGGLTGGARLDQARARARALIDGMGRDDTITLIAAGPQVRLLEQGNVESNGLLRAALDDLTANGAGTDIAAALTLAHAALDGSRDGRIVILSDAAFPPPNLQAANLARFPIEWQTVGGPTANRAVVILAARSRGAAEGTTGNSAVQVYARVANYDDSPFQTSVRLFGDDRLLGTRLVNLSGAGEAELTWTLPPGIAVLRVELEGQDALPADNRAYLSLNQTRPINAVLVSATPGRLERALRAVPGLNLTLLDPAEYVGMPADAVDLTIFEGVLPERWPTGGVLAINPPAGSNPLIAVQPARPQPANLPAPAAIATTASGGFLDGVSLGGVSFGPLPEVTPPPWAATALAAGETPLILRGRADQSEVAIWTFDLAQGNLTSRLAFPLLVARTVRDLTPPPLPASLLAGAPLDLQSSPRATALELRAPDGAVQTIALDATAGGRAPAVTLEQAGIYTLVERTGDTVLYTGRIAVNAGSALESDLRPRPLPVAAGGQPAPGLSALGAPEGREEQPLWPWLVALALLALFVEWGYVHRRQRTSSG